MVCIAMDSLNGYVKEIIRHRRCYSLNADWERVQRFPQSFVSWIFLFALCMLLYAPVWFVSWILSIQYTTTYLII